MSTRWQHKEQCDAKLCYCCDPEDPDPTCNCGAPGWACVCIENCELCDYREFCGQVGRGCTSVERGNA